MPLIDFIRMVRAAEDFKLSDNYSFIDFQDFSKEDIQDNKNVPDILEIWARVKIPYEGNPPESYKVLNLMIGDWVEKNLHKLTSDIHTRLKAHFNEHYPESDSSELDQVDDTAIWTDQLDFMPDINEDQNEILIDIELVLHGESDNE